jgi:hypothetical protein
VRKHLSEVGQERRLEPRPVNGATVQGHGNHRLFQEGPPSQDSSVGPRHHRPTREDLPPFGAHQLADGHEYSVLQGNPLGEAVPTHQVARATGALGEFPGGRGAHHQDELRMVQRQNGGRQGMPRLLAHEEPQATEASVKARELRARIGVPSLLEHAVGGLEHLPVHVNGTVTRPPVPRSTQRCCRSPSAMSRRTPGQGRARPSAASPAPQPPPPR